MRQLTTYKNMLFGASISSLSTRWLIVLFLLLFSFSQLHSQTSNGTTGTWLSTATWTPESVPPTSDIDSDVTIYGRVTRDGDLSTKWNTTLLLSIEDTLIIKGDLTMGFKGDLSISSAGVLIILGNYTSENQSDVQNGGKMIVTGTVTIPNGNSDFENGGSLYVFDVGNSTFGNNTDIDCNPPTDCVFEEEDLAVEDPDLFDLFEEVVNPNPAPVITSCAADKSQNADASCQSTVPNLIGEVVATDDGTITITQSPLAGNTIGLGVTTVTITVTDNSSNTATCTADVLVVDITAPVPDVATLSDVSDECSVAALTSPTATDNCGGVVTVTNNATLPITAQGTTVVIWTYTDVNTNSSTQNQNVIITDITAPVISACPTNINVTATDEYCGNTATWTAPTATDNCSVVLTSSHNPGDFFLVGTTTVTYTATDPGGNTAVCTFDVIVNQVAVPIISGDTDVCTPVTLNYSTAAIAGKTYLWTVTDGTPLTGSNDNIDIDWTGTTNGTVTVGVTSGSGCTISNTINVNKNATPLTGNIQSDSKLNRR